MNAKNAQTPDILGSIDTVLEHLKPNGQGRLALEHANLLLTNLMTLLRPIRIKEQEPGGPKTYTGAERGGLPLEKVRLLKASVFRGVKEIESGDQLAARQTFTTARDTWQGD
jgi:hypothetical protein